MRRCTRMMSVALVLLLALCAPALGAAASCASRFVSPSGDDAAGAGTLASPYRTVQRGLADVLAGAASAVNLLLRAVATLPQSAVTLPRTCGRTRASARTFARRRAVATLRPGAGTLKGM